VITHIANEPIDLSGDNRIRHLLEERARSNKTSSSAAIA
jgi:hypothetical protein